MLEIMRGCVVVCEYGKNSKVLNQGLKNIYLGELHNDGRSLIKDSNVGWPGWLSQ